MLYIGWPEFSPVIRSRSHNAASYTSPTEVPLNEPAPAFVWINGETVTDEEISNLISARNWQPMMLRVYGRWTSPWHTFLWIRGSWIPTVISAIAAFILLCAIVIVWNTVRGWSQ